MSVLSSIISAKQAEVSTKATITEDVRAAQVKAAQEMSEKLGKLVSEYPDMTVLEFGALWMGALKAAGHKVLATEFIKTVRMLQVKPVSPHEVPLRTATATASASPAKPSKPATKRK